jgi:hypothetical protein
MPAVLGFRTRGRPGLGCATPLVLLYAGKMALMVIELLLELSRVV